MIREARLLVDIDGIPRRLCKLIFSREDGSLYLIPFAPNGKYSLGRLRLKEKEIEKTIARNDTVPTEITPRLSIHQSGQIHVSFGRDRLTPVFIPPLSTLSGEHIATVNCVSFRELQPHFKQLKYRGSEIDHLIPVDPSVEGGRIAIYCNGLGPFFHDRCRLTATLRRKTLYNPLYFGIATFVNKPLADSALKSGVVAIAGWDPTKEKNAEQHFFFLRGD